MYREGENFLLKRNLVRFRVKGLYTLQGARLFSASEDELSTKNFLPTPQSKYSESRHPNKESAELKAALRFLWMRLDMPPSAGRQSVCGRIAEGSVNAASQESTSKPNLSSAIG